VHTVDRSCKAAQGDMQLIVIHRAGLQQGLDALGGIGHGQVFVQCGVARDVACTELGLVIVAVQQGLKKPEGLQRYLLGCHDVTHPVMKPGGGVGCNPTIGLRKPTGRAPGCHGA